MKKNIKTILSVVLSLLIIGVTVYQSEQLKASSNVGICDLITANGGHNDQCGDGQITFVNNSFEDPVWGTTGYWNIDEEYVPGWETTNSRNLIEVWTSQFANSYTGGDCQDGNQCVEINATESAALYQDFEVKPGQYIFYSFYHMGRTSNNETMELRIGKPNDGANNKLNPTMNGVSDKVLVSTAKKGIWQQRYGYYQVPVDYASDGNSVLRIAFLSTTNSSMGNLIDNIEFYTAAVYDNQLSIGEPLAGVVDPTTDVFPVTNTLTYFDRDIIDSENSTVTHVLSDNVDYVPGSLVIEGVSHSDVTYSDHQLTITNLPETYKDIEIYYEVKLNSTPNVAKIVITSRFDYASMLEVEKNPTNFKKFDATDQANLNVSYNSAGYCSGITANNGYSDDCSVATNAVYDNDIKIADNNPSQALGDKKFTVTNNLSNLNADTSFDETTTSLKYEYTKNMAIDFSTIKINGVAHGDYTTTAGAKNNILEITNLPDYGTADYVISFDATYDFTNAGTARDVFVSSFIIASTLNYENELTASYVSDKTQMNLSYATSIGVTSTISDQSANNLLKTGETISSVVTVKNESPLTINNVKVKLITDKTKLEDNVTNLKVTKGGIELVKDEDYTASGNELTLTSLKKNESVEITYDLKSLVKFTDSMRMENTVSATADEYTDGRYVLQTMNIDVVGSSSAKAAMSVVDANNNGVAGNYEELTYTIDIENTGSFKLTKFTISDKVAAAALDSSTVTVQIFDNNGTQLPTSSYTFKNDVLTVNQGLESNQKLQIKLKVKTVANVGKAVIDNIFNVVPTTQSGTNLTAIPIEANIDVSKNPVITLTDFTTISVGSPFVVTYFASATDVEDGNVTSKITYSPSIDTSVPGVHQISVKVEDSDKRSAVKNMVVLVDDGNFKVGTSKILYAKDFERYISQVVLTDAAVKSAAKVAVYDKKTGSVTTDSVTVDRSTYKPVSGTYKISFTVANETTTKREINAKVLTGNPPSIVGATFKEIAVGTTFNPMTGVTSNDDLDGDLTNKIVVTGTVDISTAGIYKLTYTVTDADKNTTTKNRIVLVNDGKYTAGTTYILYADNFIRRVGEVEVTSDAVLEAANVKAYDKQTGERVTKSKKVTLGSYTNVVGTYPITITITEDVKATRNVTATVETGQLPTLTVPSFTELAVGGTFKPKDGISSTDVEDGNLYSYINVNSTVNVTKAGVYTVKYDVTDSDLNKVTATQVVLVNDGNYKAGTNYIIYAKNFYKLTNEVDEADSAVISSAQAKLYDKKTGVESSDPILVEKNGYTNVNAVYPIKFTAANDSAATRTVNADVSNGYAPVINAPEFVEMAIESRYIEKFGVAAFDIEDGDLTSSIITTGTIDTTTAGIYVLNYSVTDSTGNVSTAKTVVLVNDGNYVVGDTEIIRALPFTKLVSEVSLDDSEIKTAASAQLFNKKTGEPISNNNITVDYGTYTDTPGKYNIKFTSANDSKVSRTIIATVSKGQTPTLVAEKFVEISVGDDFSELNYAEANDLEDGPISNQVDFTSTVDVNTPGFYKVFYNVVDLDGNEATATTSVLVNDGSYDVGSSYVIQAHGFTRRVGQVTQVAADINQAAQVKVYEKLSGTEQNIEYQTNYGTYSPEIGTYDIKFTVTRDQNASITVEAKVVSGDSPVILGDKITEVPINGTFDRTEGISAIDIEDGDVSSEGRVEGKVNTKVAGIYKLVYYVTDSDDNYSEFNRYVVVNDGTFLITDKRVIRARDFTVRVSEVDTAPSVVDGNTEFAIFDIETEEEINLPYSLNIGNYQPAVGTYKIDYLIEDEEELLTKTVNAVVVAGNAPEIIADQYVELDQNETYDLLANVVASDEEEGDLTASIDVESNLNTAEIGVYTAQYTVTDIDNNETIFTKVIVVGKEQHSVGDYVIVYAEDFERYVSEVDSSDAGIIEASKLKVYSKTTGEEISSYKAPVITTDYQAKAGEYEITFTSEIDANLSRKIIGTVLAGNEPEFTGESVIDLAVNSEFKPGDYIKVIDTEDGDITSKVEMTTDFDTKTHGVYKVQYKVTDKDGNVVTFEQIVVVNNGNYTIGQDSIIYAEDFQKYISQVDESDTGIIGASNYKAYSVETGDLLAEQPVITTDYNATVGSYDIQFTVGNDQKIITAKVIAGEAPKFTADSIIDIPVGSSFNFKDYISVSDVEDGNMISKVTMNGNFNTNQHGVYQITYTVTDMDNNTVSFTQTIIVNDGNYSQIDEYIVYKIDFTVDVNYVVVDKQAIISASKLKVYTQSGELIENSNLSVDFNGYTNEAGQYTVLFMIDGSQVQIPVNISVVAEDTDSEVDSETDSEVDSETDSEVDSEINTEEDIEVKSEEDSEKTIGGLVISGQMNYILLIIFTAIAISIMKLLIKRREV